MNKCYKCTTNIIKINLVAQLVPLFVPLFLYFTLLLFTTYGIKHHLNGILEHICMKSSVKVRFPVAPLEDEAVGVF